MKRIFAFVAVVMVLAACNSNGGWTSADRKKVISDCIKEAKGSAIENKAESYCSCMQPIIEAKYPTVKEANKLTAEDISGDPAMKKEAMKCLGLDVTNTDNNGGNTNNNNNGGVNNNGNENTDNGNTGGGWANSERQEFLQSCVQTYQGSGHTAEEANSYCSCMSAKIEQKYPSYAEANKLTSADFNTPEWKRIAMDCAGMQQP